MKQKCMSRAEAFVLCKEWQSQKLKVGFTSGAFDLLHAGHVAYLHDAREKCDKLIVGINSDKSVRKLKGEKRPICNEEERLQVVAALDSVDAIFLFEEENNNANITELKPDFYIKAGDYSEDSLSSAPLVKKHGGKVEIIPFRKGLSSSVLIERVLDRYSESHNSEFLKLPKPKMAPAIFLDRDGTINKHIEYLHEPEKFELLPGVIEGLLALQKAGFRLVIVTNQAGIGLGYFTKEDLYAVNKEMLKQLSKHGLKIDKIYFSPYSKADDSICRKPNTWMIDRAVQELNIDLKASFVVGDQSSDIQLARNAGCRAVLVKTGRAGKDGLNDAAADFEAEGLPEAASWIIRQLGDYRAPEDPLEQITMAPDEITLESLGKFAGKIGHDFNNILGTFRGCLDLIESRMKKLNLEANPFERQLAILDTAIERGVQFTTRLRSFVRPEPLAYSETNLEQCTRMVIETLENSGQMPSEVILNVIENPPVRIAEFMVVQMVLGICMNSIEAMQDLSEKVLVLHIDRVDLTETGLPEAITGKKFARLSIIDHGTGLNPKVKQNLFRPFFSTSPKGLGQGFGLGLSMAKVLMEKHGGFIDLVSEEQVGTAVHLYFPIS